MPPLLLIDASNLIYRSYWAFEGLATDEGEPTGAIYGTLRAILSLKLKRSPRMVFCWDSPTSISWRRKLFPEYKAKRTRNAEVAASVTPQFQALSTMVPLLGYRSLMVLGLEADDLIALAAHASKGEVLIFSSDKDMHQLLLNHNIQQIIPAKTKAKEHVIDARAVEQEYLVPIELWSQYLALGGDTADDITPQGMGPKTAQKLIAGGVRLTKWKADYPEQVKKNRQQIGVAWKMARLPHSTKDPRISHLTEQLDLSWIPKYQPSTPTPAQQRQFTQLCERYQLLDILSRRQQYFVHTNVQQTTVRRGARKVGAQLL